VRGLIDVIFGVFDWIFGEVILFDWNIISDIMMFILIKIMLSGTI
jgi:hypothetical protein